MKNVLLISLCFFLLSANLVSAEDVELAFVHAEWDSWINYSTGPTNMPPNYWDSYPETFWPDPLGEANTGITVFLSEHEGRQDIIQVTEDVGDESLEFWMPNLPFNEKAEITIQMTFLVQGGFPNNYVSYGYGWGHDMPPVEVTLPPTRQGLINHGDGWATETWLMTFEPTPINFRFGWHRFDSYPAYVDKIIIDMSAISQRVTVPEVVDMNEPDANAEIEAIDDIYVGTITYECNNVVPSGLVIWQDPAAGERVVLDSAVNLVVSSGACVISANVDIKLRSDPNSINPFSRGVIPVAILTTEDFDALTVDEDSVLFAPAEAEKKHKRAHVEDVDDDGDLDLLLHFRTQDTGIALGDTEACLIGQTYDGVPIMGCDSVRTVPPN